MSKWFGLFYLARYLTRKGLRILAYHSFVLADEAQFRPGLFITPTTFHKRMRFLSRKGFPVLKLEQALNFLDQAALPPCATVITIDDGFYSTYSRALEVLHEFSLPATVYVTTYYLLKEHPIFRLVVQYMFWKTKKEQVDLSKLGISSVGQITFNKNEEKENILWEIIRYGETQCNEVQRLDILRELGKCLGVEYHNIEQCRLLSLINPEELQKMVKNGIDIQLHTHRHRLPLDACVVSQEIADNRATLEPLVKNSLQHLCYPSGVWSEKHWPWLEAAGILSATTCDPGLNYGNTPRLALHRFLDGEDISQIEFESEMFGYSELLRRVKSYFK